jgi:Uncharacterized protein conserved in bacteria|tara:strand:+ start:952 stop:1596 length:645 start_codon:yes stop_codon:yes gene_type:complete
MDEEISIINSKTKEEKIKNFFVNNKNKIISIIVILVLLLFGFFFYKEYKEDYRESLANKFNIAKSQYSSGDKSKVIQSMEELIDSKDSTYSPLALYFLIDNKIVISKNKINEHFDQVLNEVKLDKEIKNLIIYKKALFNSEDINENDLLKILNPLIKSDSVWKSHSLYLLAEYYFHNNQKQKAKEFYEQIINLKDSNKNINSEVKKRLQSEYSE